MQGQRNNLLAGLLVIASIFTVIAAVIMLGGGFEFLGKRTYSIRFELTEGVSGLKKGAAVHVGGVLVGSVKQVELERRDTGEISGVLVDVSIDHRIVLREGAQPYLILPLLGSQGIINFPVIGKTEAAQIDRVLDGQIAPPGFLAQAGYGDEQKEQLQGFIARASAISENFGLFAENARDVSADVRENWPTWSDRFDSITDNVDRTTEHGPEIAERIEERLAQIKEIGTTVQGVLDENRENMATTSAKFASIGEKGDVFMERLNEDLTGITEELLQNGRDAFAGARDAVRKVDEFLEEQRPNLRRTLANLRLGSDQLRDTLVEIRRSPWRLVYRPDLRELNYELLYDSARHYAASVSDLRAATESLESLVASSQDTQIVRESTLAELLIQLREAYEGFDEAEQAFMEQLLQGAPTKAE